MVFTLKSFCLFFSIYLSANESLPIYVYEHDWTRKAVIGGYVYRGTQLPWLNGQYIFADFLSLWAFFHLIFVVIYTATVWARSFWGKSSKKLQVTFTCIILQINYFNAFSSNFHVIMFQWNHIRNILSTIFLEFCNFSLKLTLSAP